MVMSSSRTSVFDLSVSEKLQLLEDLWGNMASDPAAVPLHDWQKKELNWRKRNLLENPSFTLSWDEIRRKIRTRYGR